MAHVEKFIQTESVEDKLHEIAGLKTQFDVFRFMKRLTENYGARTFMVAGMPQSTSQSLAAHMVINNWPAELITLFDKQGLLATSPPFKKLRTAFLPFQLEIDEITRERGSDVSWQMFSPYGLVRTAFFPVHDSSGTRGIVALGGDAPHFDLTQMMELSYLFIHVYEKLGQIRDMTARPADTLTQRELDCLNWTAAGKTSSEIAGILGLSEHTVNHYLNRAAKKLDAVNRTQAVATALRTGLIG